MAFLARLNLLKFDFMLDRIDGNMVKFQQSQALTSHFESFWSIVIWLNFKQKKIRNHTSEKMAFTRRPIR